MSQWAERFAALTGTDDIVDTVDTVASRPPGSPATVHSVKSISQCQSAPLRSSPQRTTAETIGCRPSAVHNGNIVYSVTDGAEGKLSESAEASTAALTVDTVDDLAGLDHLRDTVDSVDTVGTSFADRAAIVEFDGNVLRYWVEGYEALASMSPPAGFLPVRWRRVVDSAAVFMDCWAKRAAECGWGGFDVFGCHSSAPDQRFDCMGIALLLDGSEIVAIDEAGADLVTSSGDRQRFYRRPLPPGTVSLWQLQR
jgi:hypothetical protein